MIKPEILLGINIDHIATLRQARGTLYPDPIHAALESELGGADGITLHLREDRRHIQERDLFLLKEVLQTKMNLEMAATQEMVAIATKVKPACCCLVPEKREELTTEGGLDVVQKEDSIRKICTDLKALGIEVSLFIDPELPQIDAAYACGAPVVELHTGAYAGAVERETRVLELKRITEAARFAQRLGLIVNAGHGLNYHNVEPIAALSPINELNIGHAVIARALFTGMKSAVYEMKLLMRQARR